VTAEHPAAGEVIGLYRRHAAAWARDRGDALPEIGWLRRFAALMPQGGTVLDLGCGAGRPVARWLIAQGFAVTGVDAAPEMIALCRKWCPRGDWRVADMRGLELGRRFAGVLAWDSFFHLGHAAQRGMFGVFRAHAAPGAALMFTAGPAHGEAIGAYGGEALHHASLDGAEYRALLAAQGFGVAAQRNVDPEAGGRCVWLARLAAIRGGGRGIEGGPAGQAGGQPGGAIGSDLDKV
jgi:SAM-dependent methyltransferase